MNTLSNTDATLVAFEKAGRRRATAIELSHAMTLALLAFVLGAYSFHLVIGIFFAIPAAFVAAVGTFVGVLVRRRRGGRS